MVVWSSHRTDGHDMDFCHLCVQCDWALANVFPMVALGRLHVDHLSRKKITSVWNVMNVDHSIDQCQRGTWSQYSSVSKRKVQLNFGTPLHRISIGTLFLTWGWKVRDKHGLFCLPIWNDLSSHPVLALRSLKRLSRLSRLARFARFASWFPGHISLRHYCHYHQLSLFVIVVSLSIELTLPASEERDWVQWRSPAHKSILFLIFSTMYIIIMTMLCTVVVKIVLIDDLYRNLFVVQTISNNGDVVASMAVRSRRCCCRCCSHHLSHPSLFSLFDSF